MTEHRDTPGVEPDDAGEVRSPTTRRFARLIESPAGRRVALPRIFGAIAILSSVAILIGIVGSRMVARFVASGADYQLPFAEIELVPDPGPWVKGGRSRILEMVRAESNRPEMLSLLDLDANELEKAFRRNAWVKDVRGTELSFRHLRIDVTYRKPVAVVILGKDRRLAGPIDEESVYLPPYSIVWTAEDDPFQAQGFSQPLIEIRGVESSRPPKPGMPWKGPSSENSPAEPDPMILRAARLAEFLQRQERSTPSGRPAPSFASIQIPEPGHALLFFLEDKEKNLVEWGKAPGDEKSGELSSDVRWKMLLDWVDHHGPLVAKYPRYLQFTRDGARIFEPKPNR